jgi:hypothetical protein
MPSLASAEINSARLTVATPSLPTTMAAARIARWLAVARSEPLASVINLDLLRRNDDRLAALLKSDHPLSAARHHERADAQTLAKSRPVLQNMLLGAEIRARHRLGFDLVHRDHVGISVQTSVAGLGVHRRDPFALRKGRARHLVGHQSFRVIRDDHRPPLRPDGVERLHEPLLHFAADRVSRLAVDAHDLLALCHDPRLDRGRTVRSSHNAAHVGAALGEVMHQSVARVIRAAHAHHADFRAKRQQVVHNVRRATRHRRLSLDFDHHHRRFRRNPGRVPPKIGIDHEVAYHRHPRSGESLGRLRERLGAHGSKSIKRQTGHAPMGGKARAN